MQRNFLCLCSAISLQIILYTVLLFTACHKPASTQQSLADVTLGASTNPVADETCKPETEKPCDE
ncbi:MAG TPA: hypothetical protein VJC18_10465 [bacterium]|nr:hypothetical protein [bacterium]